VIGAKVCPQALVMLAVSVTVPDPCLVSVVWLQLRQLALTIPEDGERDQVTFALHGRPFT